MDGGSTFKLSQPELGLKLSLQGDVFLPEETASMFPEKKTRKKGRCKEESEESAISCVHADDNVWQCEVNQKQNP